MSTPTLQVSSFTNPLRALAEQRREEEAVEQARQAAEATQRKIDREAAERQRRAEAKQQYLIREVKLFAKGFLEAVAKYAVNHHWSAAAIEEANTYAQALLRAQDHELPHCNPAIKKVVWDKFVFGLALNHTTMPNVMASHYFVGMRQANFEEAFSKSLEAAKKFKQR